MVKFVFRKKFVKGILKGSEITDNITFVNMKSCSKWLMSLNYKTLDWIISF